MTILYVEWCVFVVIFAPVTNDIFENEMLFYSVEFSLLEFKKNNDLCILKSGLWKILLYFRLRICTRNWCQPEKIWSTASKRSQGNSVVETYTEGIAFPKSSHWRKLFQEDLCEPDPIGLSDPIGIVSNLVKCDWDDVACCVKIAVFVILLMYCERCYSTAMMIGVWLFYSQNIVNTIFHLYLVLCH